MQGRMLGAATGCHAGHGEQAPLGDAMQWQNRKIPHECLSPDESLRGAETVQVRSNALGQVDLLWGSESWDPLTSAGRLDQGQDEKDRQGKEVLDLLS